MKSNNNVGTGVDCSIREFVEKISDVVGFSGKLMFDDAKLDDTSCKLKDLSRMNAMGWSAKNTLCTGLKDT